MLVSDNAQEFVSPELNQWVAAQGIRKMKSPIYFPRANGLVERSVQTVKKGAAAWKLNSVPRFQLFPSKAAVASRVFDLFQRKVACRDRFW